MKKQKGGIKMYYQNGNYMQDLNYYNQNPNNYNWGPYQNFPNQNRNNQMQYQNLNSMYPAVYRIIAPVVSQVLGNNNYQFLTEDMLNNMVDSVYSIVEGDISVSNNNSGNNELQENQDSINNSKNMSGSKSTVSTSNSTNCRQNALLRDLIKIMILNEVALTRQNVQTQLMLQNANMNNQMYM